ncbi:hypothetical protein [Halarchaeum nitratireducens]|nr:hypothetical protein [Halarchaeum nitratireducens]
MSMDEWSPPDEIKVDENRLSSLEVNLTFDPHDDEAQVSDYTSKTYSRLSTDQRRRFEKDLQRDTRGDFDSIHEYLNSWKNPNEYNEKVAQSYEKLVKDALSIPTGVRNGGEQANYPTGSQKHTFERLYVATQCFLAIHYGTREEDAKIRVHRGIREISIAKLVAQMIDNPEADEYYFYTSAVSNHSGLQGVGFYHSNGIIVSFDVPRDQVAFAADRLVNTPAHEDELQLVGGILRVGPKGVIHEGTHSGITRRMRTIIQSMSSSESLDNSVHKDIADLIEMMFKHDEPVTTSDGADRLIDWFYEVRSREIYSAAKTQSLKDQVDYLKEAGQENEREHRSI